MVKRQCTYSQANQHPMRMIESAMGAQRSTKPVQGSSSRTHMTHHARAAAFSAIRDTGGLTNEGLSKQNKTGEFIINVGVAPWVNPKPKPRV